ncbi:hypothetical protein F2Q70_00018395 [Brassica cretica]|uniref:Uncharacterized protein n=1 Tax=Brassica cretica TaxID=69181 RepID=A0A8S9I1S9_BRACR|nr:hypothetical protein F2Q70_00018395 [Brassica cretica]
MLISFLRILGTSQKLKGNLKVLHSQSFCVMGDDSGSGNYYFCQAQVLHAPSNNPQNNLESKFSRVGDNYRSIKDEVASALPHAGLESSYLIVGIDAPRATSEQLTGDLIWGRNHSVESVKHNERFVEEDHRASTHHMLKQRVMRMVSGMLSLWVVTVSRERFDVKKHEFNTDASDYKLLKDVGFWLPQSIKDHFKKLNMVRNLKYIDNVYCTLLARSVVHGAMAGYTGYTSGLINGRPTNIPYNWNNLVRHDRTVVLRDGPDLIFFVVAEDNRDTQQCGDYRIECGQG